LANIPSGTPALEKNTDEKFPLQAVFKKIHISLHLKFINLNTVPMFEIGNSS
jgi:hypothetical protein